MLHVNLQSRGHEFCFLWQSTVHNALGGKFSYCYVRLYMFYFNIHIGWVGTIWRHHTDCKTWKKVKKILHANVHVAKRITFKKWFWCICDSQILPLKNTMKHQRSWNFEGECPKASLQKGAILLFQHDCCTRRAATIFGGLPDKWCDQLF